MEKLNYKREILLWVLLLAPFAFAAYTWNKLPETIAIHFDLHGTANGWGNKWLILLMPVLNLFLYLLFLFLPKIDPKMMSGEFFNGSFYKIRIIVTVFMAAIAFPLMDAGVTGHLYGGGRLISSGVFLLFAVLGNFLINIKPNWFIGIRTPWTLSSDVVWKKTHLVGGRLWFYGGLTCFVLSLLVSEAMVAALLIGFVTISVVFAVGYSFWLFKQEETTKNQ